MERVEIDAADPVLKLRMLRDKYEDMDVMLTAINEALEAMQLPVEDILVESAKPVLQTGIRIRNKLSDRGQVKARELFERLDEDSDGLLSFREFRAMLAARSSTGFECNVYASNR